MAFLLPPQPVGVPPGHSMWNDWYEKLRYQFNNGQVSVTWANIDFSGSNLTDLVTRSHDALQSVQGGSGSEHYHLTAAQHTIVGTLASGSYTPTVTTVANLSAASASSAQYMRVGNVVTVSGSLSLTITSSATTTTFRFTLPIASNITIASDVAGVCSVTTTAISDGSVFPLSGDTTNDAASASFLPSFSGATTWYYTFTYEVI